MISREPVRAVLVDYRPAGTAGEQTVRLFVKSARGSPVLWLTEGDAVVEVAEAVAAGVCGVYYWDQLGPELLSAIHRLTSGT